LNAQNRQEKSDGVQVIWAKSLVAFNFGHLVDNFWRHFYD